MRALRRLAGAAAITIATGFQAFAQQPATTTGGGNIGTAASQTVNSAGATTTTTSGGSSSGSQGSSNGSQGSSQGSGQNTLQLNEMQKSPTILAPSKAGTTNSSLNASNFLRNYYGAVYFQGSNPNNVPNGIPGGFGATLYPATGGTTGGRGGTTGTGGQGGRGGAASSSVNTTDPGGQIVALPRQIAYASQIQFKMPTGNALPQLQLDLRGSIDRVPTSMLANPAGVQVDVAGRSVVLRGTVRDEEESHLVEGLVRLTPGVAAIKNELTFPK